MKPKLMERKPRLVTIIIIFGFLTGSCFALDDFRINFIDVGDGDAILIQTTNHNALIDTGNLLSGHKLIDTLKKNNIRRLDYLILTHTHLDHMGGIFFIVPEFQIQKIFDNGQDLDDNEDAYRWYKKLIRSKENYRILKAGDILNLQEAVLEVLWPDRPNPTDSFNANSLVIMLRYKNFKCLFTGDLNGIAERKLLKKALELKADVLKLAHHGFFDATSQDFLERVSPKLAIISVDAENIRNAPSEETLNILRDKDIKIYRTDKNGNIVVSIGKQGNLDIETQR